MKVLLVNGSPHKEGCTYTALKEVANTLEECGIETEIFWIGNRNFGGCIACKSCVKTGQCVYKDCVNECREKANEADGFIFGTPVHYAAASGSMTAFMTDCFTVNCAETAIRLFTLNLRRRSFRHDVQGQRQLSTK